MRDFKIFPIYLRSRAKTIAAWVLEGICFGTVFALYSLPLGAVLYGMAVSGFFMIILGAADFFGFAKKHRALVKLRDEIVYSDEFLPPPSGGVEEDYDTLIRLLRSCLKESENRLTATVSEMTDCYTLWAHQIKTPIAAMGLILQRGELSENDRVELREELDRVEHYVQMALCFVRLSSESSDFVIKEYSLDDIVRQGAGRFYSQLIRRRLTLSVRETELRVITDEKWLVFVIEQVMSNAVKYTRSGGIEIYAEDSVLCIKDSGGGVAQEDLPRIFEKGFTGEGGRLDKKASGVGLYLCQKICRKLSHEIWAENCNGGLVIKISLGRKTVNFE
ncbi:MAG: sensor histidine kinase [Oscillospiraceae bacterium]|nr:sensor histidine kinase [Oscillospiraceae bacterium]